MKLSKGHHLAYCTNVHRGNNWSETFASLENDVMQVKKKVCPDDPYAIGLRLGAEAAEELSQPEMIKNFKQWLEIQNAYVFTINGFPYGNFHGTRVKEQVYRPDWTTNERLDYTLLLFSILEKLLEPGEEGSVSTLPGSFKEFLPGEEIPDILLKKLDACALEIEKLAGPKNLDLHLGMEPEPLGLFETTPETVSFFDKLLDKGSDEEIIRKRIGVNYDCCHLAIEFEDAHEGLDSLVKHGIRLSKLHLSSALSAKPTENNLLRLKDFIEPVYLHQVTLGKDGQCIRCIKDLDAALEMQMAGNLPEADEWRIHFHVPLHASPGNGLGDTRGHVTDTLDWLAENPHACRHLEMETYTWEVLPDEMRSLNVVDQVIKEYDWTLDALQQRGLGK
ncbi:MAG: hypothetical protein EBY48_09300 [Opitutae bacterium]|nr:hypothetical protein [Opitutae bacterium]